MQMFIIAINNGDFMTQVKNITTCTVFTYNKKRHRKTDVLAVNNEFQPYDVKCKYAICSGIV